MKKLLLIIINFQLIIAYAQNPEIDSLENLLHKHSKNDTIKVNLLNKTADNFSSINIDKTLQYTKEAEKLSDKLNYSKGKAESFRLTGNYYIEKSNYSLALEYFQKALKINEKTGETKKMAMCLKGIGVVYWKQSNFPESLKYYKKALKINEQIKNEPGIAKCYTNIGIIYSKQGNYPQTIKYYNKALKINEKIGDELEIGKCFFNIGMLHSMQSNFSKALEFYQKSLKIFKKIDSKKGIALCFNSLGILYYSQNNYHLSLEYLKKSLKIQEQLGNKYRIGLVLNNMGRLYQKKSNYPKAIEYYQKAFKIKQEIGDKLGISYILNNIGEIEYKQSNYKKALEYHQKSLTIKQEIGSKYGICYSYKNIGEVYLATKNYPKALNYSRMSLKIAIELGLINYQSELYKQLSEIFAATKNYKKAYENYQQHKKLNDSVFNEESIKKITGLEYQYEYEKEKQAIELKQQKKDAVYAQEIKQQKNARNSFVVGFILMALLVSFVFRSFLQKRKANRVLSIQKKEIEAKNQQLEIQKREIQVSAKELKKVNNTKDKFFSIIAHDLKSPFNSILGFLGMLMKNHKRYNEDEREKFIKQANSSAIMTFKLLENLLTWAQLQSNKIQYLPQKLNLKKTVSGAIAANEGVANKKEIQLLNNITNNEMIFADINMIDTVLRNLISNAIKFTEKNGKVIVSSQKLKDRNFMEISVSDTGVGIAEDKIDYLFRIDKNTSTTGTENEKGTGLGLILCKDFVEKHNGNIYVKSELGKGSNFVFTMPIK